MVPRAARADVALRQARSAARQRPCPGLPKENPAAVGGGCGGPSGLFSPFAFARGISAAPGSSARGTGGTGGGRAAHPRARGSKTRLYRSGCREVLGDAGATELRNAAALVTRAGAAAGAALCNVRGVTSHARWAARPCCHLAPRGRGVKSCSRSVYADVSFEDARRCLPGDSRESVPARSTRLRRGERRLEAPAAAPPPRDGPHVSTPAP